MTRSMTRCVGMRVAAVAVALAGFGCAARGFRSGPLRSEFIVVGDDALVRQAALRAFEQMGLRVVSSSKELVGEREFSGADAIARYAAEPASRVTDRWWSLHATLTVRLEPVAAQRVRVNASAELLGRATVSGAPAREDNPPAVIELRSNGRLEQEWLDELWATLPEKSLEGPQSGRYPTH